MQAMDLASFYHGPLGVLSAFIFIAYQQKILELNLFNKIVAIAIKICINIALAALIIWIFHGLGAIYWGPITKMALIMQIGCAGVQIAWKAYKNNSKL
jgi:hypothetical protein